MKPEKYLLAQAREASHAYSINLKQLTRENKDKLNKVLNKNNKIT